MKEGANFGKPGATFCQSTQSDKMKGEQINLVFRIIFVILVWFLVEFRGKCKYLVDDTFVGKKTSSYLNFFSPKPEN